MKRKNMTGEEPGWAQIMEKAAELERTLMEDGEYIELSQEESEKMLKELLDKIHRQETPLDKKKD